MILTTCPLHNDAEVIIWDDDPHNTHGFSHPGEAAAFPAWSVASADPQCGERCVWVADDGPPMGQGKPRGTAWWPRVCA